MTRIVGDGGMWLFEKRWRSEWDKEHGIQLRSIERMSRRGPLTFDRVSAANEDPSSAPRRERGPGAAGSLGRDLEERLHDGKGFVLMKSQQEADQHEKSVAALLPKPLAAAGIVPARERGRTKRISFRARLSLVVFFLLR